MTHKKYKTPVHDGVRKWQRLNRNVPCSSKRYIRLVVCSRQGPATRIACMQRRVVSITAQTSNTTINNARIALTDRTDGNYISIVTKNSGHESHC
jgi:hypothetical protein